MEAGEAHVVIGSVYGDVLQAVFLKLSHELLEVFFAAFFTHLLGGEVRVHAGTVPVGVSQRLTMVFDVNAVALADACENVASHPNLVSRRSRAFAKDLKL